MRQLVLRTTSKRLRALLLSALAAVLLLTACAERPPVRIDERYPVETLARARILIEDGSITVVEGRPGQILVTGEYPQDVHEYAGSVAAAEARIELRQSRGFRFALGQRGARLEVTLPPGIALEIESSNGRAEVTGAFRLQRLKAANGPVVVTGAEGDLLIESANGPVRVERHSGALAVRASNGTIEVTGQRDGLVTAITSNGAIRYEGAIDGAGEHLFETSNGAVEVIVAGVPAFTLDATTSNGGITSRYALLGGAKTESRLTGRVGDGPARLVIRTSNGAIEVR